MARVDFRPYKREQLEAIVRARLQAGAEGRDAMTTVMEPDAIRLAAARVAAVSGDARRVLDVCR
jgi:origin recognition complex subunit 1